MEVTWTEFKKVVDNRKLSIQYVEVGKNYYLKVFDGRFELDCIIPTDVDNAETSVFIASYKALGNISPAQTINAGTSKTIGSKKLFKRVTGIREPVVAAETTSIIWTCPFNWAKFTGVEFIGAETGDYCSFKVLDAVTGTYSTIPSYQLNQFGFTANIGKDFYTQISSFDADIYVGIQIKLEYYSVSGKTIGINFIMSELT